MADVYASVVGTTVLQLKEIPLRPTEFDGVICLFGLCEGADEAQVRRVLGQFGSIKSCELHRKPAVVRFTTHEAAVAAKAGAPELCHGIAPAICDGIDTMYNERSYDGRKGEAGRDDDEGRGWCALCCNVARAVGHLCGLATCLQPNPHTLTAHFASVALTTPCMNTRNLVTQVLLGGAGECRANRTIERVPKDEGGTGLAPAEGARTRQRQGTGGSRVAGSRLG